MIQPNEILNGFSVINVSENMNTVLSTYLFINVIYEYRIFCS